MMATFLHRALENLAYWTEQITPTCTIVRQGFARFDSTKHRPAADGKSSSGWFRVFKVRWLGSASDGEDVTDRYERTADHRIEMKVSYPPVLSEDELRSLILQDRHDLYKRWRDDTKFVGYDKDNLTTALGLIDRIPISDEMNDENKNMWTVTYSLTMRVREVEE